MEFIFSIDSKSTVPIFQQIVNGFEELILTGKIKEGEFLPSVREFAIQQSINPNTVSKAYQILQSIDVVESVRGTGLRVKHLKASHTNQRRIEILSKKSKELVDLSQKLDVSPNELMSLIRTLIKEVKK